MRGSRFWAAAWLSSTGPSSESRSGFPIRSSSGQASILMDTERGVDRPGTTIGHRCRIDRGVIVHDGAVLGDGVVVGSSAVIKAGASVDLGVKIGRGASLGAFSRVEDGAVLGDKVITADKTRIRHGARLGAGTLLEGDAPVSPGVDVPRGTLLTRGLPCVAPRGAVVEPVQARGDGSISPPASDAREPRPVVRGEGRPAGGTPAAAAGRDPGPSRR